MSDTIVKKLDELLSHLRVAESQLMNKELRPELYLFVGHLRDAIRLAENIKLFSCKVCGRYCDRAVCPETYCGQERPEDTRQS